MQVRVGGGFMKIQDFLKDYTPLEIEKIMRHDAFTRFQNQVMVLNNDANDANGDDNNAS